MNINSVLVRVYYPVKRYLPRRLQLFARRLFARTKRHVCRHCWPIDPDSARLPENWGGWPEGKRFAVVLTHDVDTLRGHDRCLELMNLEREAGFVSSFNFVAGDYPVSAPLRATLVDNGFEVGLHGIYHNAELYESKQKFDRYAVRINRYLQDWQAHGFRSPCMYHNLEWLHGLDVDYDASTFDTDPFEPQPDGMATIFPFLVEHPGTRPYVELPYTLPQDFTLFVLFREKGIGTWQRKLDWVARQGGMVLLNTHPDYIDFSGGRRGYDEYPARFYQELLQYIRTEYRDQYWHVLPHRVATFWRQRGTVDNAVPVERVMPAAPVDGISACA